MGMYHALHWIQAAADARAAAEPHAVTFVDFLVVTLTAMCVLLAALGFIVAVVSVIGYRDIKAAAMKSAKQSAEAAIEAKLKEYPDAAQLHGRFAEMDRYMGEFLKRERALSRLRAASPDIAKTSKTEENRASKRLPRYPKKEE